MQSEAGRPLLQLFCCITFILFKINHQHYLLNNTVMLLMSQFQVNETGHVLDIGPDYFGKSWILLLAHWQHPLMSEWK